MCCQSRDKFKFVAIYDSYFNHKFLIVLSKSVSAILSKTQDGTTLRYVLAAALSCGPMRITKKFAGIGELCFGLLPQLLTSDFKTSLYSKNHPCISR